MIVIIAVLNDLGFGKYNVFFVRIDKSVRVND